MEYNFREIENKWQEYWRNNNTYKTEIEKSKPKFYVLDMFPYPSGAGLHVGHPLGYIASDIYSRFKKMQGFNVLHPMGYDAFGLPAEQYAIQTGQHPAITTDKNVKRYREQLDKIGFSYDWSREFRTCDPKYYKWTQWVFIQLFNHWFNNKTSKADNIDNLISHFESHGTENIDASCTENIKFSATQWKSMNEEEKQKTLLNYRLAFLAETMVNWCPALGTVLANDEVKEGFSVRGGHPVEQKKMQQWLLRVSAYSERLLNGLDNLDWSDSLKEMQRNWIGKSEGAEIKFCLSDGGAEFTVFTTRPDTIFGCTFMVLAPESELVDLITTNEYKEKIEEYRNETKKRTERERLTEVKKVSGQFTGSYASHPFTGNKIPIWISDYVLAGYGTGAIMAVPAHDSRDFAFAKHFNLPIIQVVSNPEIPQIPTNEWTESFDSKEGIMINSDFINGLNVKEAITRTNQEIEKLNIGKAKINYRMRDAIFSRQRYWGEPFPIYYKNNVPYTLSTDKLPLELPEVDAFLPTEDGQPPLARAKKWHTENNEPFELSTMPGFAGSSAYYLRYMDPHNDNALVSKEANDYWQDVDLYIGGTEHATGHLIYSRFWNKFLFDLGFICKDEPFKKLINQGMIQGRSNFVNRLRGSNIYFSLKYIYTPNQCKGSNSQELESVTLEQLGINIEKYKQGSGYILDQLHVDVNIVSNDILNIEEFKKSRPEYSNAEFILEDGKYICGWGIEKMSKSLLNVVNPDDIVEKYGADTLRFYEMFLGPLEMSKPWDTNGIDGVHRFLKKLWRLFYDKEGKIQISNDEPTNAEYKIIHKTIKKIKEDIENFSFNTSVSAFMICVNELTELKCYKKNILSDLILILAPFAPHIAEELWLVLGNNTSVTLGSFPKVEEKYLVENSFEYPISFNGKLRFKLEIPLGIKNDEIEKIVLSNENTPKYLEGKTPKKIIIVPGKIVNIVV